MSDFIPALDEDQLEQLGLFLETEYQERDALDFFGAHGLITALTLGPKHLNIDEMIDQIFEQPAKYKDAGEELVIKQHLKSLQIEIQNILDTGDPFYIPCDLSLDTDDEEPAAIELWAAGFVEASFLFEEQWYGKDEEQTAELMIPLMYASGLFMDEEEMQVIEQDPSLEKSIMESIPDIVSELYLHFHGDEKK